LWIPGAATGHLKAPAMSLSWRNRDTNTTYMAELDQLLLYEVQPDESMNLNTLDGYRFSANIA